MYRKPFVSIAALNLALIATACGGEVRSSDEESPHTVPQAQPRLDEYPLKRDDPRAQLPDRFANAQPIKPPQRSLEDLAKVAPPVAKLTGSYHVDLETGTTTLRPTAPTLALGALRSPRGLVTSTEEKGVVEKGVVEDAVTAPSDGNDRIGVAQQGLVTAPDSRAMVVDTLQYPARTVVKIYVPHPTDPTLMGSCTGTMIDEKTVLTDAHCIHWGAKVGLSTSAEVVPAQNGAYMPFGSIEAAAFDYPTAYPSSFISDDYAIITLKFRVGDATGFSNPKAYTDAQFRVSPNGAFKDFVADFYDSTHPHNMYSSTGSLFSVDATRVVNKLDYMDGASGAAIRPTDANSNSDIPSIIWGDAPSMNIMYSVGTRISTTMLNQINSWKTARNSTAESPGDFTNWIDLTMTAEIGPAITSSGSPHLFNIVWIDPDSQSLIYLAYNYQTSSWEATGLGGPFTWKPAIISRGTGLVDIFGVYVDPSTQKSMLLTTAWSSGGGWWPAQGNWWALDSAETQRPVGEPTVVSLDANHLDVFVRNINREVLHKSWTNTRGWSTYENLGGSADAPIAAAAANGGLDVVIADTGKIRWKRFNGSTWTAWTDLLGTIANDPPLGRPTLQAVPFPNLGFSGLWLLLGKDPAAEQFQSASRPGNNVQLRTWSLTGWSSSWQDLGGDTIAPIATASPTNRSGLIEMAVADRTGVLQVRCAQSATFYPPTSWRTDSGRLFDVAAVHSEEANSFYVVGRGPGNELYLRELSTSQICQ